MEPPWDEAVARWQEGGEQVLLYAVGGGRRVQPLEGRT